jgi:radical SAM protein (TIGR01212 family)
MNEHYYSLNRYLRETFGEKVYKLALDGDMTCPNRDGTIGTGGCIFCSAGGSGDFAEGRCASVAEQIEKARARVRKKTDAAKFIAYFQSYTNTYAPVEYLETLFSEAIAEPSVVALSIGTRPDCLPDEVIDLLSRLNKIKPVWVELGLQTIHEETARYIRRGYPLPVYEDAVARLRAAGITVITHVILGLPGESREMMLATIDYLGGEHRPDGVKLQLLHVLEGTDLAADWRAGKFTCMEMEEYFDLLCACLERLPADMVIHRLTGDGPKRTLLAPLWTADKKRVLNELNRALDRNKIQQRNAKKPLK